MNKAIAAALLCVILQAVPTASAAVKFEKVTDHYYWLESSPGGIAMSAVVSEGGILIVNPPGEPAFSEAMKALQKISSKPVNWIVCTDYALAREGNSDLLGKQGASLLGGVEFWNLIDSAPKNEDAAAKAKSDTPDRMIFGKQVRLFPDNLEIRVIAIQAKARTAGDLVVAIPAEKVLIIGDLFSPGSYPTIDASPGNGTALGWLEGMKQAIDAVPLVKSAMPAPKPDPSKPPPEEKTLEELIFVVPGHGPLSNLQEAKSLYDTALKLKGDAQRSVSSGRSREHFLSAVATGVYRQYANLEPFAGRLYDELLALKAKTGK